MALFRMGWSERISEHLPSDVCMHAVGQGALGWLNVVIVVYHVTLVASWHVLLNKFGSMVPNRLRPTHYREFPYLIPCQNYC